MNEINGLSIKYERDVVMTPLDTRTSNPHSPMYADAS